MSGKHLQRYVDEFAFRMNEGRGECEGAHTESDAGTHSRHVWETAHLCWVNGDIVPIFPFLRELWWGGKPQCPSCTSEKESPRKKRKGCRCRDFPVKIGMIFEKSNVSPQVAFWHVSSGNGSNGDILG